MIESIFLLLVGALAQSPESLRDNSHYMEQWKLGLVFCSIFMAAALWKKYNHTYAIVWGYFAIYSSLCFPNRWFGELAAESLMALFVIPMAVQAIKSYRLWFGFELIAIYSSAMIISGYHGVLENPAMDGTFLAVMYPAIAMKEEYYPFDKFDKMIVNKTRGLFDICTVILPPIAIFMAKGSVGIGLLVIFLTAYLLHKRMWLLSASVLASLAACAYLVVGAPLLSFSGRIQTWDTALNFWTNNSDWIFGNFPGSTARLLPKLQSLYQGLDSGFSVFMHNDWLQILFETGLLGFSLVGALWIMLILRTKHVFWLMMTNILFGISMLAQFPLRIFLFALYGALILQWSQNHGRKQQLKKSASPK